MDIRKFFGAGDLKKDDASKKQKAKSKPTKSLDETDIDKNPPERSDVAKANKIEQIKKKQTGEKKAEKKLTLELSDEEIDFKKSKKKGKTELKKSDKSKEDAISKGKQDIKEVEAAEETVSFVKDVAKKRKRSEMKKRANEEEEEEEEVMIVSRKPKAKIIDSDSEEDPLPKSIREVQKRKKGKSESEDDESSPPSTNPIAEAFTRVVPKQKRRKEIEEEEERKEKKESRRLVNAIDFFGTDPVSKGSEKKEQTAGKREVGEASGAAKTLSEKLAQKKSEEKKAKEKDGVKKEIKEEEESKKRSPVEQKKKEKEPRSTEKKEIKGEMKEKDKMERTINKKDNQETKEEKETSRGVNKRTLKSHKEEDEEEDEEQKKKKMKMSYMAFKSREPPKALGSKEIPQGAENCLEGMTFVLTGVYESIERDEVKGMVERLGGKVTTSVSRNTSYLLVGRDAGASKLDKARDLGTKQLDEDGFFELVRKLPAKKSKYHVQAEKETPSKGKGQTSKQANTSKLQSTPSHAPSKTTSSTSSSKTPKSPTNSSPMETSKESEDIVAKKKEKSSKELPAVSSLLWTDKYRPNSIKQLIGQQGAKSPANKLLSWMTNWHKNSRLKAIYGGANDEGIGLKAALLSGPPGIGKTSTAQVVCKELNISYVELNASDTRSKRSLKEEVAECLNNQSLLILFGNKAGEEDEEGQMSRHCLIMDEVDGMSGNEDRGGMQELIQLIKGTRIPIICLCNDRNHPKIRSLANYCFDLRFQRPRVEQIKSAIMSIAYKEGLKIPPPALNDVIAASNHDLRQILHNLSLWTVKDTSPTYEKLKNEADKAKKDMHYSPFDVCRKVFSNDSERRKMTLRDKSDLFFHDYSIAPLFIQENYLSVSPVLAKGDMKRHLWLLSKAADVMCQGDVIDATMRRQQMWSLLPLEAIFASVLPGELMRGGVAGMVQFPSWLGKNSTANKNSRLLQEINHHTSVSIKGNKQHLNQDYLPALKHLITRPLIDNGDPTPVVDLMNSYDLLREDLENIKDLTNWTKRPDLFAKIDSKVKAALTRQFNKQPHLNHYASKAPAKKGRKKTTGDDYGDEEEEEDDEGADDDDPNADSMIVVKKPSKAKQTKKKEETKKTTKQKK